MTPALISVSVRNAYKSFGKCEVLKDFSMTVEKGTIYGLLGASGCGKTTLLNCLVGLTKPDSGQICVLGATPSMSNRTVFGPRIGYMPQELSLVGEFTVEDALNFFGRMANMSDKDIKEQYRLLTEILELPPKTKLLKECSAGQQRRVSFACTLVHKPALLVLDEPTVGADPLVRERIWNYLTELAQHYGTTAIITTHYIDEAQQCDTALLTDEKSVGTGSPILNSKRFKALMSKNWKQFYRNVTGVFNFLIMPVALVLIFFYAIGGEMRNLPLGVVNKDCGPELCSGLTIENFTTPTRCQFDKLGCRFLTYLDDPMFNLVPHDSIEEATNAVKHGHAMGVLYIPSNFTPTFERRIRASPLSKDVDSKLLNTSEIKLWLDMSNQVIGYTARYKLIDTYKKFLGGLLIPCGYKQQHVDLLAWNKFYENAEESFRLSWVPGVVVTFLFFISCLMCCELILNDRLEGIWERSAVAGVSSLEIILSHLTLQTALMIFQTAEIFILVFVAFQVEFTGDLWLLVLIAGLQGFVGMSFGFAISVAFNEITTANMASFFVMFLMYVISGIWWPVEGMPVILQWMSKCLSFPLAIEAFRDVMLKGWSISEKSVLLGIGVELAWIMALSTVTLVLIKYKRVK